MEFTTLLENELNKPEHADNGSRYSEIDALGDKKIGLRFILSRIVSAFKKSDSLAEVHKLMNGLISLYNSLNDGYSRGLLVKLIAHRLLGRQKYKLPLYSDKLNNLLSSSKNWRSSKDYMLVKSTKWRLYLFDLEEIGYKIRLYHSSFGVIIDFILKQYEYKRGSIEVKADAGDYVLDLGGFIGDTALFFSSSVGEAGKVFCWEFVPSNLKILHSNLNLNAELSERITIIESPVYSKSGLKCYYTDRGPSSRLRFTRPIHYDGVVKTLTIDDFVTNNDLEKVDFIKMDIEGAEMDALVGAQNTINEYRPKLAIAIYHYLDDFVRIPEFILSLNLNYRIFIDHYTPGRNETVLYAITESQ